MRLRFNVLSVVVCSIRAFSPLVVVSRELPLSRGPPLSRRLARLPATAVDELEVSADTAYLRAKEIGSVLLKDVVGPILFNLNKGTPNDWNEFWKGPLEGACSNAERVAKALESMGPTFVKFGQALSSRQDIIPPPLAEALSRLQDKMEPFDTQLARKIIQDELERTGSLSPSELADFMQSISEEPVAAASIGQVYQGYLPGRGKVALKVQRPGIFQIVKRDSILLRSVAEWVESLSGFPGMSSVRSKLVATKLVASVDEFMSRIFEELDYRNEAKNMELFSSLYSHRRGTFTDVKVVVPDVYLDLCTDRLIVMEWIDGIKLEQLSKDGTESAMEVDEKITLVKAGITATLTQLLGTGIMHADPHPGNLVKVETDQGPMLGFLDFGMLSTVPVSVRDALVCAVVQVVFARDTQAVADLFGELQLLPSEVLKEPKEREALAKALDRVFRDVLRYPDGESETTTPIPILRFDKLLGGLSHLVTRFQFSLPPYFVNIARALATLEGVACTLDPSFNALRAVYPFALHRILQNPSMSPIVEETLFGLLRNPNTKRLDPGRMIKLIDETAVLSGLTRRRVLLDVVKSRFGKRVARKLLFETILSASCLRSRKQRTTNDKLFKL